MNKIFGFLLKFAIVEMVFISVVNIINMIGYEQSHWWWPNAIEVCLWYPIMLITIFTAVKIVNMVPAVISKITKKQKYNLLVKGGNII